MSLKTSIKMPYFSPLKLIYAPKISKPIFHVDNLRQFPTNPFDIKANRLAICQRGGKGKKVEFLTA